MCGLEVQENVDLRRLPVETVLLIADVADRLACSRLELRRIDDVVAVLVLLQKARRQANLAGDHNAVRRRQRLAGNAHAPGIDTGLGRFAIDQIDDLVGDTVTHFVRVAFGYGFTREQVVCTHAGIPLKKISAGIVLVVLRPKNKRTTT
ncbi:hypothetical protein D3C87_1637350 [compost metagenome]